MEYQFWAEFDDQWTCWWFAGEDRGFPQVNWRTSTLCLHPAEEDASDGTVDSQCECPAVEPVEDRIARGDSRKNLPGNVVTMVGGECGAGQVVLGGMCTLPGLQFEDRSFRLMSAGFSSDHTGWECAWKGINDDTIQGANHPICLRPPSPASAAEADPLLERIVYTDSADTLPASGLHIVDATCALGDTLLWGGCTVESPESHPDVKLVSFGVPPESSNRPNTWQCTWDNPDTGTTANVTATAVCLQPFMASTDG